MLNNQLNIIYKLKSQQILILFKRHEGKSQKTSNIYGLQSLKNGYWRLIILILILVIYNIFNSYITKF